jgi:hypothetical protein
LGAADSAREPGMSEFESAEKIADSLAHKLEHILVPGIRQQLVREALLKLSAELACDVMGQILTRPRCGDGRCYLEESLRELLLLHPDGKPCSLPYDFRSDIYRSATTRDDEAVLDVLRSTPKGVAEKGEAQRLPVDLVEVPLGRRRSLAKSEDSNWLELLARDPDPIVMRNLLRNPRIRELDVVRIAALRPIAPEVLHEVASSPRWSANIQVRSAIARNPYCATDLASKMIASLPLAKLREMRGDADLHPATQRSVRAQLERHGS